MASLDTTRNYDDGEVLVRADFDAFLDDIEAFINVTKINDDNIQNSGITGSTKLLNQSVTASKLASDSVTTLKIADSNVTTAKLADDAVTNAKLADNAVDTAQIADNAVTNAKMADSSVGTAELIDVNVTTGKIADLAVTTAKINDSAVTTAKINAGAVTTAKLGTNYVLSTLTGTQSGVGTSYVQAAALTTNGRPVAVVLYSGSITGTADSFLWHLSRYDGGSHTTLVTGRNNTSGGAFTDAFSINASSSVGTASDSRAFVYIDNPSAGTYNYEIALQSGGASNAGPSSLKMLVYEL